MQASWRHTRPETSIFQWIVFEGDLQDLIINLRIWGHFLDLIEIRNYKNLV